MGTFEELWGRVEGLPDTAIAQVPSILSDTKKKLSRKTPEEIGKIVNAVIDEVNIWKCCDDRCSCEENAMTYK